MSRFLRSWRKLRVAVWLLGGGAVGLGAQSALPPAAAGFGGARIEPNQAGATERALHYRPDGTDFVVVNGPAHFNRPLYAARTSFRVDAGDRPEFALNLPRKGGVLRFGVGGSSPRWLHEAERIEMRYRPGSVIYTVRDPAFGQTTLTLTVQAVREQPAALWRVETDGPLPGPLVWSFAGGSTRAANERNGDIIAGRDPAEIMTPTREETVGNQRGVGRDRYVNRAGAFDFLTWPRGATGAVEFEEWNRVPDAADWMASAALAAPVMQGNLPLFVGKATFLGVFATTPDAPFTQADLAGQWTQTESARAALAARVTVDTPDPYINALPGALLVAADAVWQEPDVMHGAIAWRLPLLGWRGPAALDPLGWHERFRAYARHWIARQNVDPTDFPDAPAADPAKHLATDDWRALHGYGSIPARHYDMALGFVDLLLRHLMWTGDREFAREIWPFLERHLEWEKRCFDRDGLYEGYAAIWASDALTYNGGGTTHASALNYWHRLMAARIAEQIGADPTPHRAEAERIHQAMLTRLWDAEWGTLGEYVERTGLQRLHRVPALWTFYHAIDSHVLDRADARAMAGFIGTALPHLPVVAEDVARDVWMMPTSRWQPYEWSLNNVVPSENAHAALAFWQAGRPDLAWSIWKGTVLDAMYLSASPGNLPNLSQLDVHRRETYRDFADPMGTFSRALVEGLFGVQPDAIADRLTLAPGWPRTWDHASLETPDFVWRFRREGLTERWHFEGRPGERETVQFILPAQLGLAAASVNGVAISAAVSAAGEVVLTVPGASVLDVALTWAEIDRPIVSARGGADRSASEVSLAPAFPGDLTWEAVPLHSVFNDRVDAIFRHDYLSPRSPYVSLSLPMQGIGSWSDFKAHADLDDRGLRRIAAAGQGTVKVPGGATLRTPADADAANVAFVSWWDNFPRELTVPLSGQARQLLVMVAGSTSPMHSWIANGEIAVTYTDGSTSTLSLSNPLNWWPIERDYVIDDYAFRREAPVPWRLELATGRFYQPDGRGGQPAGGAATVLALTLDPHKELKALQVRALSTEVVIGLLAASLAR